MEKINQDDVDWKDYENGESEFRRKELSNSVESEKLGCSLYELPPGKQSWPYHYHTANEEAIFVLEGEGQLRAEGGKHSLEKGDFVTLPADSSGGHTVFNDSDRKIRYLMVSTMNEPDVTVYPKMEKLGIFVGDPPGGRSEDGRDLHGFYKIDDDVSYWGEDGD